MFGDIELLDRVKGRTSKFEEAISRDPDLAYQEGSDDLIQIRDTCIRAQADVRHDLEGLVREIMLLPVVEEFKGGSATKVARTNYDVLKIAIEKLELDDNDAMLAKLTESEAQLGSKESTRRRR